MKTEETILLEYQCEVFEINKTPGAEKGELVFDMNDYLSKTKYHPVYKTDVKAYQGSSIHKVIHSTRKCDY